MEGYIFRSEFIYSWIEAIWNNHHNLPLGLTQLISSISILHTVHSFNNQKFSLALLNFVSAQMAAVWSFPNIFWNCGGNGNCQGCCHQLLPFLNPSLLSKRKKPRSFISHLRMQRFCILKQFLPPSPRLRPDKISLRLFGDRMLPDVFASSHLFFTLDSPPCSRRPPSTTTQWRQLWRRLTSASKEREGRRGSKQSVKQKVAQNQECESVDSSIDFSYLSQVRELKKISKTLNVLLKC